MACELQEARLDDLRVSFCLKFCDSMKPQSLGFCVQPAAVWGDPGCSHCPSSETLSHPSRWTTRAQLFGATLGDARSMFSL